jgi:hypothetical protein
MTDPSGFTTEGETEGKLEEVGIKGWRRRLVDFGVWSGFGFDPNYGPMVSVEFGAGLPSSVTMTTGRTPIDTDSGSSSSDEPMQEIVVPSCTPGLTCYDGNTRLIGYSLPIDFWWDGFGEIDVPLESRPGVIQRIPAGVLPSERDIPTGEDCSFSGCNGAFIRGQLRCYQRVRDMASRAACVSLWREWLQTDCIGMCGR